LEKGGRKLNIEKLFSIKIMEGRIKVTPSEELLSMSRDQQITTLESELRKYESKLQNISRPPEENEFSEKEADRNSDIYEVEFITVILKKMIKQFRESHWEHLKL